MDVFKVKTFLRAVELGSLSKAAQELGYAPSALSHMLRGLEQELGLTLLHRSASGIALTESGKAMLPVFRQAVEAEDAVYTAARKLNEQAGTVRIGTYASISKLVLPRLVREFNRLHPEVKISVTVADRYTPQLLQQLDMVFAENTLGGQCWLPLLEDEYVAVVREDRFPGREAVTLAEMEAVPFILPNDTAVRALCRDRRSNIIEISADDDGSLISMVREGLGFTVLPGLSAGGEPGVRLLRLVPSVKRTLGLSYSKSNLSPAASRLVGHIRQQFERKEVL